MSINQLYHCPFAKIKMTFANFFPKSQFLLPISLNRAKNHCEFPCPCLAP